jgi:hypothetical protein
MLMKNTTPKPAAIEADGTKPFTPEEILEQLRVIRLHIPDFGPLAVPDAASLRSVAHVDDVVIQAATNSVGASARISSVLGTDVETLRTERQEVDRWSAVEEEAKTLFQGVASANLVRRHRLGLTSLQVYAIARQLVRKTEHAHLLPHVEAMRQRFRNRRVKPAEPTKSAEPAVPTTPTQ